MHTYSITTLVDITENGVLRNQFPFTTKSGELVHDGATLTMARNQQSNFTTLIQLLQMRSNITWEATAKKLTDNIANWRFGSVFEGRHAIWQFEWQVEQDGVYEFDGDVVGGLIEDFDQIPIINFCKETAAFPRNVFNTQDPRYINTYFTKITV
jgi:hypothetical protein